MLRDYVHHFSAKQSLPVAMENHKKMRFCISMLFTHLAQSSAFVLLKTGILLLKMCQLLKNPQMWDKVRINTLKIKGNRVIYVTKYSHGWLGLRLLLPPLKKEGFVKFL